MAHCLVTANDASSTSIQLSLAQIVEWLPAAGPVAIGKLTRRFKKRLTSDYSIGFVTSLLLVQIVKWLRAAGPVAMGELTRRFKKRLTSDAQRKAFGATIKKVAVHKEITPGAGKVIMLKDGVQ